MKRLIALPLAALCAFLCAGCAKQTAEPPDVPPEIVNDIPAPAVTEPEPPDAPPGDSAVYSFGALEVPVPAEYRDLLAVNTRLEALSSHWTPLISFSERASVEAGLRDHPDEDWGDGWLCTLSRLDRIGFEEWASGDAVSTGASLFAMDSGGNYYLMSYPTDVRFYRSGDAADSGGPGEGLDSWVGLNDWAEALPGDIIARNGLAAYDASELFDADYTYAGAHMDVGCSFPGETMDLALLVLSQPARQGEGGVWCVERVRYVYSEYDWTDTHLVFPAALGIDMAAADYYAQLQAECDAGAHPELLSPKGAALDYARHDSVKWLFGEDVSETDFEIIELLG